MSDVIIRGTRENLAGLLTLMARELEAGQASTSTMFSDASGGEPWQKLTVKVDDSQKYDTTMVVHPA